MDDRPEGEAPPTGDSRQVVSWSLPLALISRIEQLAAQRGLRPDELAADVLRAAIGDLPPDGSARCSLRIERSSEGPRPLPLLQG